MTVATLQVAGGSHRQVHARGMVGRLFRKTGMLQRLRRAGLPTVRGCVRFLAILSGLLAAHGITFPGCGLFTPPPSNRHASFIFIYKNSLFTRMHPMRAGRLSQNEHCGPDKFPDCVRKRPKWAACDVRFAVYSDYSFINHRFK
jgi:hypothetical protein